ncbi:MAG: hypothetical protein ACR2P1_09570 [Pseudomonadales bacterium]
MQLSVEISLYPLKDEYVPAIVEFIARLEEYDELRVIGNTMSTQVFGEYDLVTDVLRKEMRRSFATQGRAIFVCKFIDGDLSPVR